MSDESSHDIEPSTGEYSPQGRLLLSAYGFKPEFVGIPYQCLVSNTRVETTLKVTMGHLLNGIRVKMRDILKIIR